MNPALNAASPVPQPLNEPATICALGVDAAALRACLLEPVAGSYRLAAWLQTPRRGEEGIDQQLGDLLQRLGNRLHRTLWSEREAMPLLLSDEPVAVPPLGQLAVAASPRGHVRVWVAGLTATQSLAAAEAALASSPAAIVGSTSHTAGLQAGVLVAQLAAANPDLVVIVGGYDNPELQAQAPLYELARLFGRVLARTAPAQRPGVVFAGNRWAASAVIDLVQAEGGGPVEAVENVQPAPGVLHKTALAQAVNFAYWRLCRRSEGMRAVSRWVTSPGHIMGVESCFAQLVQVWMDVNALPELHGVYAGPAWWLHVRAVQGKAGLEVQYVEPHTRPPVLADWPAPQLVSGEWPAPHWPVPERAWWDRSSFAPMLAAVGQAAPQAMLQVLRSDILSVLQPG